MKILGFVLLLLSLASCDITRYFHYDGTMKVDNVNGAIFGPIIIEFKQTVNMTYIAGMYVKDGVHTPFEIASKILWINYNKYGAFIMGAACVEGRWGKESMQNLKGNVLFQGDWSHATFSGLCEHPATKRKFAPMANAVKNPCVLYEMPEAAKRAKFLVGEKSDTYHAAHLLNHAVYGYPYLEFTCKDYLQKVGTKTSSTKPGVLIIGNDAEHCAIVDEEGDKFIQVNPVKKEVTMNPLTMIKTYFRNGYTLKEYKC